MRGLLAGFLRELGLLDLVFQFGELVAAFFVAELLLDRLHLLVEIVLALGLLHLPLDAGPDALFYLQHGDFALHQAKHPLQALGDDGRLQDFLLVGNLDGEMRSNRVGELGVVLDLLNDADNFRRHFLVQLHVVFEFGDDRTRHGLGFHAVAHIVDERGGIGFIVILAVGVLEHLGTRGAFDQHLHGTVGQLQQLQDARERADLENRVGRRIVVGRILLRRQKNEGVGAHDLFERLDRLFTADEERNDHVRKHHDVAQRQNRVGPGFARLQLGSWLIGHGAWSFMLCPCSTTRRCGIARTVPRRMGKEAAGVLAPDALPEGSYAPHPGEENYELSYASSLQTLYVG